MVNEQLILNILSSLLRTEDSKKPQIKAISIDTRDQFLTLFCLLLINNRDKSKFSHLTDGLFSNGQLKVTDTDKLNLSSLELELLDLFTLYNEKGLDKNTVTAVNKIGLLVSELKLTKLKAISLYERVLQRLQESRGRDVLATDFTYYYLEEALLELIEPFIPSHPKLSIYDPLCHRGELLSYVSSIVEGAETYSECLKQSSIYIKHKLSLSSAVRNTHFQRSALSADTTFDVGMFDFAITACIASPFVAELPSVTSKDLKGHIDSNRIEKSLVDNSKSKEFALIQHMIWTLKKDGTGLILLDKGPLQRYQEKNFREKLVSSKRILCVVRFHDKVLGGRAKPIYALSFQKSSTKPQTIQFIDARSLFSLDNAQVRIRDKNNYLNIIKNRQNIEGISRLVSLEEVANNNFNLCPEAYISSDFDENDVDIDEVRSQLREQIKITDDLFEELLNDTNS